MKTIGIINLRLTPINSDLTLFNCESSITGVIHTTSIGSTTVVLNGDYVLGKFGCPHVAIDELTNIHIQLHEAEKESGTYAEYKRNMVGMVFH
ncbi:DNA breaking-rejoining protein [Serratia fonticola]